MIDNLQIKHLNAYYKPLHGGFAVNAFGDARITHSESVNVTFNWEIRKKASDTGFQLIVKEARIWGDLDEAARKSLALEIKASIKKEIAEAVVSKVADIRV